MKGGGRNRGVNFIMAAMYIIAEHFCTAHSALYVQYTVEPLNKGHFGSRGFVLFSEVVLWWEVQANRSFIDVIYLDNMF